MSVIDVINGITQGANALSATKQAHDHIKDLYNTYATKKKKIVALSMFFEDKIVKNVPTRVWGTGQGLISIYSQTKMERQVIADRSGHWYTMLYFSECGTYDMAATDGAAKVEKQVEVTGA